MCRKEMEDGIIFAHIFSCQRDMEFLCMPFTVIVYYLPG